MKLTKDSILALYGNTPTNPSLNPAYQNPFPQNFAVPGNFPTYSGVLPSQTYPTVAPQQQQFVANAQWGQCIQPNQYAGFQTQFATTTQMQYPQQNAGFVTPNPFGGITATAAVQQQFASLNLGNPTPSANSTPTVATNLWQ